VRQLPHDLVAAFRATLQETREADLLLHVIDACDERKDDYQQQVNQVLTEIGAGETKQILVYNKIDELNIEPKIIRDAVNRVTSVWLSARTGAGLDLLAQVMEEIFKGETVRCWLDLPPKAGRIRAKLFELGVIIQEKSNDLGGWRLEVVMPQREFDAISKHEGISEYACRE
jgi:GTP-binding protein HflX